MGQKFTQGFEFHLLNLEVENELFASAKGESSINQEQIVSTHHQEMCERGKMHQKNLNLAKLGAIENENEWPFNCHRRCRGCIASDLRLTD
jgi:hypothetical protein